MASDPVQVLLRVTGILEGLHIPHAVGGSTASSIFGEPRATEDADLIADIPPEKIPAFLTAVQSEFYVSEEAVREAVRRQTSFNLIHTSTLRKVDIFVAGNRPMDKSQLERKRLESFPGSGGGAAWIISPEDVVLVKLDWYRRGREVSDRQWRDILGVLKIQGRRLDRTYVERMALHLNLGDLLARALSDAGQIA